MNYSDIIGRSFRTLRSGALWGFAASITALRYVVMLGAMAGIYYGVGSVGIHRMAIALGPSSLPNLDAIIAQVGYFGAVAIGSLLSIPISLISIGGLAHLGDEVLSGREARYGDGWTFGGRFIGRVFLIRLVVSLLIFAAVVLCVLPLIASAVAGAAASASPNAGGFSPVPLIAGLCCGYLLFIILFSLVSVFIGALDMIAIRYAVIGRRTVGDALASAAKAILARWKNVFVFSLILIGLGFVWFVVISIVLVPVQLATSAVIGGGARATPTLARLLASYAINGPLAGLLVLPYTIFAYSMWTAFFRQMTGLDVVPTPASMYTPSTYGYAAEGRGFAADTPYAPAVEPGEQPSPGADTAPAAPTQSPDQAGQSGPIGPPMNPHSPV